MMIEPKPQPVPEPFDQEKEIRKQTELLQSINGKLGFFVFITIAAIVIQILGALMSF